MYTTVMLTNKLGLLCGFGFRSNNIFVTIQEKKKILYSAKYGMWSNDINKR